jgi:hypothetical protein
MKNLNPKSILIILLSVWALTIIYRIVSYEKPKTAPLKYVKGKVIIKADEITVRDEDKKAGAGLRMDLLNKKLGNSVQITRNIFAPLYTPPPPPPKKPAVSPPPPKPEIKVPTPEEIAAEKSKAELLKFKYLGFINKGGINEVFLSKDNELISTKKGEIIKGRYLIRDATPNSVIIQDKDTQIEQVVTLSGG